MQAVRQEKVTKTFKDRIKALLGSMNRYRAIKDALEEAEGDLALARLKAEELQTELEKMQGEYETVCYDCQRLSNQASRSERAKDAYRAALFSFCPKLESTDDIKRFYRCVEPKLDEDGFRLYFAAKKLTGIECHSAFPYEDARGMFEEADGRQLMTYLTAYRFGTVDWNIVPGTCYESASLLPVDTATPEYQAFEREIYTETLRSMGFQDLLPGEMAQTHDKTEKKKGDDAR